MIGKVLLLLAVLLILFVVYEIIGLFKKKARTAYVCEDGRFLTFGDAVFSVSDDSYIFHDYTQLPANRFQGHSNVENGLALINLRNDPSSSDLTYALHKEGWVDLSGNIYATTSHNTVISPTASEKLEISPMALDKFISSVDKLI